jgi:hypothetical protein
LVGDHVTNKDSTGYKGERMERGRGYAPPVGPIDNVAACGVATPVREAKLKAMQKLSDQTEALSKHAGQKK